MPSKSNNEFFQTFMVFLAFLLAPLTTHASGAMFVEVELSCGPTPDKKYAAFSDRLFGAIAGPSIVLTRSWIHEGEVGFSPLVGYIYKDKLIIKGEGRRENSTNTNKWYFSKKSEGTLKSYLQGGVEGKSKGRKCKLTFIQDVSNDTALRGQQLAVDNARLKNTNERLRKQVKDFDSAPAGEDKSALIAEINSLKEQVKELEGQVSGQADTSENLVQMATVIASLKDQLSNKDNRLAELNGQLANLEETVALNNTKSQQTINGLEAKITEKNNNIQSLTTTIQTLQNTPAKVENCPEVAVSAAASDDNNPIIEYLEGKNAELTKQLENCGKATDTAAQDGNAPTPKHENAANKTDVVFENKWQLSDAVGCSSGSYTIYDKKLGNVFVLNGEKQISPNPTNVEVTQLAGDKVRIVTEIFANDMFKQLNNGEPFAVFSSSEDITVLNEGQINVERSLKQLDTNRFMSNPADKFYNTSKEGGKKESCGLLFGVKQNDQASSGVQSEASKPAVTQKPEPLALPSGKFEAATFCSGAMVFIAGDDFIQSMPELASMLLKNAGRHLEASRVLASRGLEGENMLMAGGQSVMDISGDTIEEAEIERGSTLHGLLLDCRELDTLR